MQSIRSRLPVLMLRRDDWTETGIETIVWNKTSSEVQISMSLRDGPYNLVHEQHKVPVTSLEFHTDEILLTGEGTHLVAYDTTQRIRLGSARIFRSQAIHKILTNQTSSEILVCGGSKVAFVTLQKQKEGLVILSVLAQKDVGDWIFNAAFPPPPEYDSATTVALVTAHNALIKCTLRSPVGTGDLVEIIIETIVSGSNCILYCARISWLSATRCLVASGTAFGDIIIWSSPFDHEHQEKIGVKTHYIFQAHEGSVFDVQVTSPLQHNALGGPGRVMASCSDDRTIRLWDISDLGRESPSMTDIQRETGFGSVDQLDIYVPPLLAKATGHISRIWMVRFILETTNNEAVGSEHCPPAIASFGEDGSCITWTVSLVGSHTGRLTHELRQTRVLPIHAGKNIWSATIRNGHGASGGADGLIALLPSISQSSQTRRIKSKFFCHSEEATDAKQRDAFRSYTVVSEETVVATTTQGHVVIVTLHDDGTSILTRYGSYESLSSFSMMTSGQGLTFIAGIRGDVLMLSPRSKQCHPVISMSGKVAGLFLSKPQHISEAQTAGGPYLLITTVGSTTAQLVNIGNMLDVIGSEKHNVTQQPLTLPPRFIATSFIRIKIGSADYSVVGSRNGSLAIYDVSGMGSDAVSSTRVLQYCHGKESVTAMRFKIIDGSSQDVGYLFSAGRDGTCVIHRVTCQETSLSFELMHQLELPFGPNIEGLDLTANDDLLVWGFKSKKFIVHDITAQQDSFTVECGGGVHRNWAYGPSASGGTFIWTQTSTLMRATQQELPLQSIHSGGHGREIKALAVSPDQHQVIATGAEDTDIKLSTYSFRGGFRSLQTLRKHNTGIQHLQWSTDGCRLFSSAGSEEFCVWRVSHDVPVVGIGVVCESTHPRSMSSDLRVMGFDVSEQEFDEQQNPIFHIVMVYSDSLIKLWSYDCRAWSLQRSGDYLTACLTHVNLFPSVQDTSSNICRLLTTATDGHIASWDYGGSDMLTWSQRRKVHQNAILDATASRLTDDSILLATSGDDNGLTFTRVYACNEIAALLIPRAHAAAVTALAMHRYSDDRFCVISASIDQRVKMWDVRVDATMSGVEGLHISKTRNVFTSVADVSSMTLLQLEGGATGVLLCGVGMDVWRLEHASTFDSQS